jgi:hypothetical protein
MAVVLYTVWHESCSSYEMTKIRALAGRELSEEDIGALADEAECGYDIDEAIGPYPTVACRT